MRDEEPMDANEYLMREIQINRLAAAAAIHEHRFLKARNDDDFQWFMVQLLGPYGML